MRAGRIRAARAAELIVVFVGIPVAVRTGLLPGSRLLVLCAVAALGLFALLRDPAFARRPLWSADGLRRAVPGILLRGAVVAIVVTVAVLARDPAHLLEPPLRQPAVFAGGLLAYALASALPQELLYRVLFFHRYASLFPGRLGLVLASGAAFAVQHVVYPNALAPLLSLPAGLALAATYARTRTLGPVWLEHTLYGSLLFALGLGGPFAGG